jgi:hypothetical protein
MSTNQSGLAAQRVHRVHQAADLHGFGGRSVHRMNPMTKMLGLVVGYGHHMHTATLTTRAAAQP